MKHILLTRNIDGSKQLVNMELVSEAIRISGNCTRLVIPSALEDDARHIDVKETPEQIAALL